jgi:predicted regulator of Ras-like GTPase activity (Roadblock/LC7/MglB family)
MNGSGGITEAQFHRFNKILSDLFVQAEAEAVFLCDYGGNIICKIVSHDDFRNETIAALASGSFAATNELALLVGESTFHSIYHKGTKASLYMQNIGKAYLVLVVFGGTTTVGLVKLYTDKSCEELESCLNEVGGQQAGDISGGVTFEIDESASIFASEEAAPEVPQE